MNFYIYMKGGYTLDQLPAHCRAGADRCYAVPPRSFAHYVANFEMQMEAPTLWTMDNQFDHKASGVRAAFGSFGPNQIDLAKKKMHHFLCSVFFMPSSRSVTIQGAGMWRFTVYHYTTSPTGKKNTWEKDTLYVCQWYHIHGFDLSFSSPSWIFVTAWRRPEEDLNTLRHTHTFLCKYFYICQLRQCVIVVVVAHIFFFLPIKCIPFSHTSSYYKARLFIRRWGIQGGWWGWGGGGISEHLPLSGRGETKHRHSGLALKYLSGTHG